MYSWKELHVLDRLTAPLVVAELLLSFVPKGLLHSPFPDLEDHSKEVVKGISFGYISSVAQLAH